MQCKDISTEAILRFLALHQGQWATHGKQYYRTDGSWGMPSVIWAMPPGTPYRLQLAKMRQLFRAGLVGGCDCGCRGDWEITDKGLVLIGIARTTPYTGY